MPLLLVLRISSPGEAAAAHGGKREPMAGSATPHPSRPRRQPRQLEHNAEEFPIAEDLPRHSGKRFPPWEILPR